MNIKQVLVALGALAFSANAIAIDVHLDWGSSTSQFQSAWDTAFAASADDLTGAEISSIQDAVKTGLDAAYAGFTVNFSTSVPGSTHEKLIFGNTTGSSGLFGVATRLDWKNKDKDDTADIYVANFNQNNGILDGRSDRATNIDFLTKALIGTTAHELGHNLGLQHYDCFCHSGNTANGGYSSGSTQNERIMATGSSGITSVQRRTLTRSLSDLSKIKLQFADGVVATTGKEIDETVDNNDSRANAQEVTGEKLSVTGEYALVIDGNIEDSDDEDFYSFYAMAGNSITANTMSRFFEGDWVDTAITLLDEDGNVLFSNTDISYNTSALMAGSKYSDDSLIWNYEITTSGKYFLKVESTGSNVDGNYDLLLVGAVPEPATMTLLGLGALALIRKKRLAKKSA